MKIEPEQKAKLITKLKNAAKCMDFSAGKLEDDQDQRELRYAMRDVEEVVEALKASEET